MLKDRSSLEKYLITHISNTTTHSTSMTDHQKWYLEIAEKYGIPVGISSDIISQRKDISEYNEFILFAITDIIVHAKINEYYTPQEIKLYSDKKYKEEKIGFPIKIHLIKITDDQYIGATSAQFLMQLREKQLINYNADTQRALRIILRGGNKMLRPYIDNKTVEEIDSSYKEGMFIPNMITLNINQDDENADYTYDADKEILKVSNISAFDIIDGYHRYLGIGRNYDRDNTWDYPMMLQVTMFSVGKAKQMIFQENHKTKMKVVDSSTYDQYNAGNIVVNRLNGDPEFYLNGKINRETGLVNPGILAQAINRLWFPNSKKVERKETISASKTILSKINRFTEDADEYLERKWEVYETLIIMYGLYNNYSSEQITNAARNISEDNKKALNRIKDINQKASNIIKEVL